MNPKILTSFLAAFLTLWQSSARADAPWPSHTVKIVVGQPAGGSTDIVARVFAEAFSKVFNQPFIIDNKPGANAIMATDFAARAPADGYTLLFTYAAAQVVNQALYKTARYDGAKDFEAVAQVGASGNILVVPSATPANSLQEFIAFVKSKPANALSYGSWGVGSGGHLSMEAVDQQAGIQMQHVPYKSATAEIQGLMAGEIQVGFASSQSVIALIKSGQLKALAVGSANRTSLLPELKTLSEQGVPFDLTPWYGLFAPKGTPREIINALNTEVNRLIKAPELEKQWEILGFADMPTKTPDEFANTVRSDIEKWGAVVRSAHLKSE